MWRGGLRSKWHKWSLKIECHFLWGQVYVPFLSSLNLNWLLQPKGHVTCKLLNHLFLDGGASTCEIKSTLGLPRLRDSIVCQRVLPNPLDLSSSTFCTFTHRWQSRNWFLPVSLFITSIIIWSTMGSLHRVYRLCPVEGWDSDRAVHCTYERNSTMFWLSILQVFG
jgi:hypothetical protein